MVKFEPSREVLSGETADVYFQRTLDILRGEKCNPQAVMEVFPCRDGILCGIEEVKALLQKVLNAADSGLWTLEEGVPIGTKEVVLRIAAPYQRFGLYETAICGMLSQASGWATAARECVQAAAGIPVVSFGARHVHPSVATIMDYAAVIGGCQGCSTVKGAKMAGVQPSGTMPHALMLIMGDTVTATIAFDKHISADIARVALVDTFKDEVEESLRVAQALGKKLSAVRLDTPRERGGVTVDLVKELRAKLDLAGFKHVGIFVSGGFDVAKIKLFVEQKTPVSGFGIGSYITAAPPIDFTADLHEVAGKPVAKRGRLPGIVANPRLKQVM
jgi:nicotinate phosphoribosyltransferase